MLIWIKDTPTSWRLFNRWRKTIEIPPESLAPKPRLIIAAAAKQVIERETLASLDNETGGILVGFLESPNCVRVVAASGPGPHAIQTPSMFVRDKAYCSQFLNRHYSQSGADYVGDWHSHVGSTAPDDLSTGDIVTLSDVLHDPDYQDLHSFGVVLALLTVRPKSSVTLKGFIARRDRISLVRLEEG